MSNDAPTTQEIYDRNVANLVSALAQSAPVHLRSFVRVLSKIEALEYSALYKFAAERILQTFAMTAGLTALKRIGTEISVPINAAVATGLTVTVVADTGTVIPQRTGMIGDSNAERYYSDAEVTASSGAAELTITASDEGADGDLLVGDTLRLSSSIAGASDVATVVSIDTVGSDEEEIEDYRARVLFRLRTVLGGGNAADHKSWGEEVSGVQRVYPYAGKPEESPPSYPGDRTVYVEATTDVDADGIAPTALLTSVRSYINNDPDSGVARPPLGLTDETLYVQSIYRTTFDVAITGFSVSDDSIVSAKEDIETFLGYYFLAVRPYVESVDIIEDKNNVLTNLTISKIVEDVISTYGGSASSITFEESGEASVTSYTLDSDEMAKLGTITYA